MLSHCGTSLEGSMQLGPWNRDSTPAPGSQTLGKSCGCCSHYCSDSGAGCMIVVPYASQLSRNPQMEQQEQAEMFLSCTALFWHSRDQAQQWSHCARAQVVPSSGGVAKPQQLVGSPSGRINPKFLVSHRLLVNCQAVSASRSLYCPAARAEQVVGLGWSQTKCVSLKLMAVTS